MTNNRRRKPVAKKIDKKTRKQPVTLTRSVKKQPTFRWGESYTSLLLGIIVVIIGILFVVSLAKTQHVKQITSLATNIISSTPIPLHTTPTTVSQSPKAIPTNTNKTTLGTLAQQAKATPFQKPTTMPTIVPTMPEQKAEQPTGQQIYTVMPGDDLWHIAEKFYKSGYNYVDIIRANQLDNPGLLYSGMKLIIPQFQQITPEPQTVTPVSSQVITQQTGSGANEPVITTTTYAVQKGDDLWNIAVRAYNDGYRWTDIAKANDLVNPGLIHPGNILKIPR